MDGVIQAPAQTGAMMAPYLHNTGTRNNPSWSASDHDGELYVSEGTLSNSQLAFSDAGFNVHMHTDGDRTVHTALNSLEALKENRPDSTLRPALAHCEVMVPEDYARIAELNAFPVISFQWGKPAQDTIDMVQDYMGEERFNYVETAGKFAQAGATVVYGSDWPVDPLNEWFAMEVAAEGIRVNCVRPGLIYTDMHADGGEPNRVDRLASKLPMQRGGQASEVAEAIYWLASDKSSFATANFIDLAGGL